MLRRIQRGCLLIVMIAAVIDLSSQCGDSNLLTNHSFESQYTDWSTREANGGDAIFSISNDAIDGSQSAQVEVQVLGANFWDIQIKKNAIALEAAQQYKLTFHARSDQAVQNMKYGGNRLNDNATVYNGTAMLTSDWQEFEYVFTPATTEDVSLFFNFGDILGTYYVDNISLVAYCPTTPLAGSFCKTKSVPGINGSEGALWEPAIAHNISNIKEGIVNSPSDLSAYYKVIWDEDNLYLVVNVTDDIKIKDADINNLTMDDGIELFIDVGNDKQTSYDTDDHHFLFRWDDAVNYHVSAGTQDPAGLQSAFVNTATGYIYEILIPWTLIGTFDQGQSIGIDVQINDDDLEGNTVEARTSWFSTDPNAVSNPSLWGAGRLDLIPCGKVYPEYAPIICGSLPDTVYHSSGLIVSHEGSMWTHNDKQGDNPTNDSMLFELGDTGQFLREIYIQGIENIDWEDLSEDDDGNFYIGGFGSGIRQETGSYDDLHIYKIRNPLYSCDDTFVPDIINFKYPNDNIAGDTEAMFWWQDEIYLIPKNHIADPNNANAGKLFIYKIPATPNPGSQYIATQLYDIDINPDAPPQAVDQFKVASAALSPDGNTLAMIGGNRFWIITDFTSGIFLDGIVTAVDFPIGLHWQREAIDFLNNTTLYTIDEDNNFNINRGKLGKIDLCNIIPDLPACSCNSIVTTDAADVFDDNVEEYEDGTVNRGSSDIELSYDNVTTGRQTIGLRFEELGIPPQSNIISAYIQFVVDEVDNTEDSRLEIRGQSIGNAPPFLSTDYDVSSRAQTLAGQTWSFDTWNTVNAASIAQRTPDISNIIQEIVNHLNWSSDNGIVFLISGEGSQTAERYTQCFNAAPRLWVEYCQGDVICRKSLSILNQSLNTGTRTSSTDILTNSVLPSPHQLIFKSQEIFLERAFQVNAGAELQVINDPCIED